MIDINVDNLFSETERALMRRVINAETQYRARLDRLQKRVVELESENKSLKARTDSQSYLAGVEVGNLRNELLKLVDETLQNVKQITQNNGEL